MLHLPEETNCPNCGKLDLCTNSSRGMVNTVSGSFGSTLYGVCQECADQHKAYYESMNFALKSTSAGKGE